MLEYPQPAKRRPAEALRIYSMDMQSSPPSENLMGTSPAGSFEHEMLRFMQVPSFCTPLLDPTRMKCFQPALSVAPSSCLPGPFFLPPFRNPEVASAWDPDQHSMVPQDRAMEGCHDKCVAMNLAECKGIVNEGMNEWYPCR